MEAPGAREAVSGCQGEGNIARWQPLAGFEPDLDVVLDNCRPGSLRSRRPALPISINCNRAPVGCRRGSAGAEGMDDCGRRGDDDARHSQGLTSVPFHIPRLALRVSFSAST